MSELYIICMVQTDSSCSERGGEMKLRETARPQFIFNEKSKGQSYESLEYRA